MEAKNKDRDAVARMIRDAQTIAICCHINPDGDTLGCATAMRLALIRLGKTVSLFCDDKVPDQLSFLPGVSEVHISKEADGPFDLMLAVDVSDPKRLGSCAAITDRCAHTALIDHHPTNPRFLETNWVDGNAPAACLMVRQMLKTLDVQLDPDLAICLYTGISTDTGNFAFASTNADCFHVMSELMTYDLPLAKLNRILFRERAMPQVKLLGKALSSLQYYENGQIAVMKLTQEDFEECDALSEHADTLVNFGLDTIGTRIAMLARSTGNGSVKISLRAKEPDRVSDIAQSFGGGGHPQASGITMEGSLEETVSRVLEAIICRLNG